MHPIYEKLFNTYGDSILRELGGYDEEEMNAYLEDLPLDKSAKLALNNVFFRYYYRWSIDAFTLGLHLGLSLLHDDVRRLRPQ